MTRESALSCSIRAFWPVRVLAGVLERRVLRNTGGDGFKHLFMNTVCILPHCITEEIVEFLDDVGQAIHLGLGTSSASSGWHRVRSQRPHREG